MELALAGLACRFDEQISRSQQPLEDALVTAGTLIDKEQMDSRLIINTSMAYQTDNGRLEFESTPGLTRFDVYLPRHLSGASS